MLTPIAVFRARPRLLAALGLGLVLFLLLPDEWRPATRALVAWCAALVVYLTLAAHMITRADAEDIRARVPLYDQGRYMVLALSVLAALASLAAIVLELAHAKGGGGAGALHLLLAAATVGLSWTFMHVMFALHYAHDFYAPEHTDAARGLVFPKTPEPLYPDFVYFSFVIGCACATADVEITSRRVRMAAMAHGVLSFVFNTAIVALTINIAAGLVP
ncbi:DUF1345 domain-containing protein [Salinarimonas soli]|uniref:DUF1345 domain-containing protein n=1 Tax=Salinarimonas soli TaxID=1638099 RepID=A0A5B2W0N1_9HYPH|nr:DUF1345 domain-containing protein [Salinarimonas soli]KAA2244026.1 DUF1345 domain-containing protein [Salinarimonas soli]